MVENPLRTAWAGGQATIGSFCGIPNAFSAEIMAGAGFDWIVVDWQHGMHDSDSLLTLIQVISSAGAVPLVRVPTNEPWLIQKALDYGAFGVVIPLINTAEQAAIAAAACRYPPRGARSYGPLRSPNVIKDNLESASDWVLCLPMIETVEGVENVEDIAATPGVDGLFIGPHDLSLSLGVPFGSHETESAIQRVIDAAGASGVVSGIHCNNAAAAQAAIARGFLFVAIGIDRWLLEEAASDAAAAARPAGVPARSNMQDTTCRAVTFR